MKNKIIYYKKLLKLIEILQEDKLYPKKYTNEKLKHELANLYMGWWLLGQSSVSKKDKEQLLAILPEIVYHIIQSIFYDTIGHYDQEIRDFLINTKEYFKKYDILVNVYNALTNNINEIQSKFQDFNSYDEYEFDDFGYGQSHNTENIDIILTNISNYIKELEKSPLHSLLLQMYESVSKIYNLNTFEIGDSLEEPIDKWIEKLKQINKDVWKSYAYYSARDELTGIVYLLNSYLEENSRTIMSAFSNFEEIKEEIISQVNLLINICDNMLYSTQVAPKYMDKPYYDGFYKYFLPLYYEYRAYLLQPTKEIFEKLMVQIDHIKDIQHHSDFFWTSLKKDTMDFISNAKISELTHYLSDPDIKRIYKKYKLLFNVD